MHNFRGIFIELALETTLVGSGMDASQFEVA